MKDYVLLSLEIGKLLSNGLYSLGGNDKMHYINKKFFVKWSPNEYPKMQLFIDATSLSFLFKSVRKALSVLDRVKKSVDISEF